MITTFIDRIQPPLASGGFALEGQNLWDPSMIKVGDTYHLFASTWPVEDFEKWRESYVIRATSDTLEGPYTYQEDVLLPSEDGFDARGCHNPKITFHNGKFILYYLGTTAWKSGVATSDSIEGPWERSKEWCIPLNNPAMWIHEDGSVYGVGKRKDPYPDGHPQYTESRPKKLMLEAVSAPDIRGPYTQLTPLGETELPGDVEHEDPSIWYDGEIYHVILTDWKAIVTGQEKDTIYLTSKTGKDYELVSEKPLLTTQKPVTFSDGSQKAYHRIERPQFVLGDAGEPIAIVAGCLPLEEGEGSEILIFPIRPEA